MVAILYPPAAIHKQMWLFKFLLLLTAEPLRNEGPCGDALVIHSLHEGAPLAVSLTLPQIENMQLCKAGPSIALFFPVMEHSSSS